MGNGQSQAETPLEVEAAKLIEKSSKLRIQQDIYKLSSPTRDRSISDMVLTIQKFIDEYGVMNNIPKINQVFMETISESWKAHQEDESRNTRIRNTKIREVEGLIPYNRCNDLMVVVFTLIEEELNHKMEDLYRIMQSVEVQETRLEDALMQIHTGSEPRDLLSASQEIEIKTIHVNGGKTPPSNIKRIRLFRAAPNREMRGTTLQDSSTTNQSTTCSIVPLEGNKFPIQGTPRDVNRVDTTNSIPSTVPVSRKSGGFQLAPSVQNLFTEDEMARVREENTRKSGVSGTLGVTPGFGINGIRNQNPTIQTTIQDQNSTTQNPSYPKICLPEDPITTHLWRKQKSGNYVRSARERKHPINPNYLNNPNRHLLEKYNVQLTPASTPILPVGEDTLYPPKKTTADVYPPPDTTADVYPSCENPDVPQDSGEPKDESITYCSWWGGAPPDESLSYVPSVLHTPLIANAPIVGGIKLENETPVDDVTSGTEKIITSGMLDELARGKEIQGAKSGLKSKKLSERPKFFDSSDDEDSKEERSIRRKRQEMIPDTPRTPPMTASRHIVDEDAVKKSLEMTSKRLDQSDEKNVALHSMRQGFTFDEKNVALLQDIDEDTEQNHPLIQSPRRNPGRNTMPSLKIAGFVNQPNQLGTATNLDSSTSARHKPSVPTSAKRLSPSLLSSNLLLKPNMRRKSVGGFLTERSYGSREKPEGVTPRDYHPARGKLVSGHHSARGNHSARSASQLREVDTTKISPRLKSTVIPRSAQGFTPRGQALLQGLTPKGTSETPTAPLAANPIGRLIPRNSSSHSVVQSDAAAVGKNLGRIKDADNEMQIAERKTDRQVSDTSLGITIHTPRDTPTIKGTTSKVESISLKTPSIEGISLQTPRAQTLAEGSLTTPRSQSIIEGLGRFQELVSLSSGKDLASDVVQSVTPLTTQLAQSTNPSSADPSLSNKKLKLHPLQQLNGVGTIISGTPNITRSSLMTPEGTPNISPKLTPNISKEMPHVFSKEVLSKETPNLSKETTDNANRKRSIPDIMLHSPVMEDKEPQFDFIMGVEPRSNSHSIAENGWQNHSFSATENNNQSVESVRLSSAEIVRLSSAESSANSIPFGDQSSNQRLAANQTASQTNIPTENQADTSPTMVGDKDSYRIFGLPSTKSITGAGDSGIGTPTDKKAAYCGDGTGSPTDKSAALYVEPYKSPSKEILEWNQAALLNQVVEKLETQGLDRSVAEQLANGVPVYVYSDVQKKTQAFKLYLSNINNGAVGNHVGTEVNPGIKLIAVGGSGKKIEFDFMSVAVIDLGIYCDFYYELGGEAVPDEWLAIQLNSHCNDNDHDDNDAVSQVNVRFLSVRLRDFLVNAVQAINETTVINDDRVNVTP